MCCYTLRWIQETSMAQKERHRRPSTSRKTRYNVDIGDLHSVCEANYLRLLRVFPGYETRNSYSLVLGSLVLEFEVAERCRFTTLLRLNQRGQPCGKTVPASAMPMGRWRASSRAQSSGNPA